MSEILQRIQKLISISITGNPSEFDNDQGNKVTLFVLYKPIILNN